MDLLFFNYLYRQPKSASHKFKNHQGKCIFCSEFIGIPFPLRNLSHKFVPFVLHAPHIFLSCLAYALYVSELFLSSVIFGGCYPS